jgi:hypothetical protein
MTHTFKPGDRISIEGTVKEVGVGVTVNIVLDGIWTKNAVHARRLTLVERPVVLPVNPYEYGPDPETGQARWEVQVNDDGWWYNVSAVGFRGGKWHLHHDILSGSCLIGARPVRPVAR